MKNRIYMASSFSAATKKTISQTINVIKLENIMNNIAFNKFHSKDNNFYESITFSLSIIPK